MSHVERRVLEAQKLGYAKMVVPAACNLQAKGRLEGIQLVPCRTVVDAIEAVLGRRLMSPSSMKAAVKAAARAAQKEGSAETQPAVLGWPDPES